jgi:hypothetical protein
MNSSSLSFLLTSLIKENYSESKPVLIAAMVCFLMESFPFMSESEANAISIIAYANA